MIFKLLSNVRVVALFTALIVVAGLAALSELPRTEDPELAIRFGTILTNFPGADAERVESLITEPIEHEMRTLPEVGNVASSSSFGLSVVTIELEDSLKPSELDRAWSEVQEELDLVIGKLPSDASKPFLDKDRFSAVTMVFGLTLEDTDNRESEHYISQLSRYAEDLESVLLSVKGTEYVIIIGDPGEEIIVELDMGKVISSGLSVTEISNRVALADTKVSAGSINGAGHRIAIEVAGSFEDLERLRRIPLVVGSEGVLMLGDIATIQRLPVNPATGYALLSGQRGIAVGARMDSNMRSDIWRERILKRVDSYQQTLPSNVKVEMIFNQEEYTNTRLRSLIINVMIGFSLIVAVLMLSLGWCSALIVAISLPLTALFALAALNTFERTIDQMTVTGLIIALGIMVDNSIVMADTVARYRATGLSMFEAQKKAVQHLWMPLLGSTLTTIFAFLPMILQPGPVGEFISGIGVAVTASLTGSFLISQIFVASLAARFLNTTAERNGHWYTAGIKIKSAATFLRNIIFNALLKPWKTSAIIFLVPITGFYTAMQLPTEFFPASDRDMFNLEIRLSGSSNAQATRTLVERVDAVIANDPDIESLHWFIGSNAPKVYYNLPFNADGAQNYAQAMIKMTDFKTANRRVPELQKQLDQLFPEAQFIIRRFQQGPPFAPIEVRVKGPEIEQLALIGEDIKQRLLSINGITQSSASMSQGVPKATIMADEGILRSIGLALGNTATQTVAATDGLIQSQILEDTQSLPIRVRASDFKQDDGELLMDFPLIGARQDSSGLYGTPLSSLANVVYIPVRNSISRWNGQRTNTITAYLQDGLLPSEMLSIFVADLEKNPLTLPPGYTLEYGGEAQESGDAIGGLLGKVGLIIILMIISIVMAFNSFRLTSVIMLVAVMAAGLGMLSLGISGYPFGFTSILGIMAMIGLAINAAIVIIAECRSSAEASKGNKEAIVDSVMNCSRHITSTTITTIMGFMPLLIAGGGFWPPFAIVVAGGTLLTTMLSLILVPILFSKIAARRAFPAVDHEGQSLLLEDGV